MLHRCRGCHLTSRSVGKPLIGLDDTLLLKKAHKIRLKSWLKHLGGQRAILWNIHGFFEVKLECIDEQVLSKVKCGSLVELEGFLKSENGICIKELKVLHTPNTEDVLCNEDLPSDPIKYAQSYHKYVKHPLVLKSIVVYSSLLSNLRNYLTHHGFIELPPPITGLCSDPGLRGAQKIKISLYGKNVELQSSVIMYKQLYASVLGKIFYTARNIRLEPLENAYSGRHLVEFTQVDVEASESTGSELISLGERALYYAVKKLLDEAGHLLGDREVEVLEKELAKPPYPRLTYDEALLELAKEGLQVKWGEELPFEAEARLTSRYGVPIWIVGFPSSARGFYYLEDDSKMGYNVDYNLLLPRGHGEVLDGGCREYRYERIVKKIVEIHGEPLEKYAWFLDLVKSGHIRPTCGWGLGVERLVKYVLNLKHIAYATPHPRLPGVASP